VLYFQTFWEYYLLVVPGKETAYWGLTVCNTPHLLLVVVGSQMIITQSAY
jgi:hypothetical protein